MAHEPTQPKTPSILIVDDVPENINLLRQFLNSPDYRILATTSGEKALEILQRTTLDLILMDVMMPEMDGYETCTRVKELPEAADTPVIFITAKTDSEDIVKGFEAGGVDYITKPLQKEEVVARVTTHLKIARLTRDLSEKNRKLEQNSNELKESLAQVASLSDLITLCSVCEQPRKNATSWTCPDCQQEASDRSHINLVQELSEREVQTIMEYKFLMSP